jgi:predicted nucleic acid-binding protein
MYYCIDASVLTNSYIKNEVHHEYSKKFLNKIHEEGHTVFLPELAFPEIASAISRGTDDPSKAVEFVNLLRQIPNFVITPVDREISDISSRFAADYKLRDCDSIYVGVAYLFNSKLITLDKDQKSKCSRIVAALTPREELDEM